MYFYLIQCTSLPQEFIVFQVPKEKTSLLNSSQHQYFKAVPVLNETDMELYKWGSGMYSEQLEYCEINDQIFASQPCTCCSLCAEMISMKTQYYVQGRSHCFPSVLPKRNICASEWDMVEMLAAVQLSIEIKTFFKLYHFSQLRGFCCRIQIMCTVKSVLNRQL